MISINSLRCSDAPISSSEYKKNAVFSVVFDRMVNIYENYSNKYKNPPQPLKPHPLATPPHPSLLSP